VLTLSGSATDQFILRISSSFALNGGQITVSGGAVQNNVFFYYTAGSDVNLQNSSQFAGVLLVNSSNSQNIGWNGATGGGYLINLTGGTVDLTNGTFVGSPMVFVTPSSAVLYGGQTQQFSATVTNAANTSVTWTISPAGAGAIRASGLYTAPATINSQTTIIVTATSQDDTTKTAAATVTLSPPVGVAVSPGVATLTGGQTQQFTAAVVNTSNTAVNWAISPTGTGAISAAGLYTAPATIASAATVTIIATSQADPTKSVTSTVTLNPPVAITVSPSTATLTSSQTQQFAATVINTSNTAVTWTVSPAGTGTISTTGLYTAPTTIASQTMVTVTATSQADVTKTAAATVNPEPASWNHSLAGHGNANGRTNAAICRDGDQLQQHDGDLDHLAEWYWLN
jgi:hypothetical protein